MRKLVGGAGTLEKMEVGRGAEGAASCAAAAASVTFVRTWGEGNDK